MRCSNPNCRREFNAGAAQCPHCHAPVDYGGNTTIFVGATDQTLTIKDLFKDTFKSPPANAADSLFAAGTALVTPTPDEMIRNWVRPWFYARVLIIGMIFNVLSYFMLSQLEHNGGLFLLMSFGSVVVPLSVLMFYWEMNIPRDVSIYRVMVIFFIGGMLSLIFTLMLPNLNGGAYIAPLTEEPAKIMALALFVYRLDCKYICGGLLIGAAVGAGFSAFEDIFYVMHFGVLQTVFSGLSLIDERPDLFGTLIESMRHYIDMLNGKAVSAESIQLFKDYLKMLYAGMSNVGLDILLLRAINTLGGHVTWAAIEGGALVWVKGSEQLQAKHFFDRRFLIYLAITMSIHCIWNHDSIQLKTLPYVGDAKCIILSLLSVFVAFTLIKRAIVQVVTEANAANTQAIEEHSRSNETEFALVATTGPLTDAVFPLSNRLTIGRDPSLCNVIFPSDTPGVSRRHCALERRADGFYIMDFILL